jgi:hypothetical protein
MQKGSAAHQASLKILSLIIKQFGRKADHSSPREE